MPRARLHLAKPSIDLRSRQKEVLEADSIITFAITQGLRDCPEIVQADLLKIMRRNVELREENDGLRHRLARWLGSRLDP